MGYTGRMMEPWKQLLWSFSTSETLHDGTRHVVRHPPLLHQVESAVTNPSGSGSGGQVFRSAYGSKPAGRMDCLALLERIKTQSTELALRHDLPAQRPLYERLHQLGPILTEPDVGGAVAGWWRSARVLTQHDGPPMAPNAPCPLPECDTRGSIRVRLSPNMAVCVACQASWDDSTDPSFMRLAEWIRWASEHLSGPQHLVPIKGYEPTLGYVEACPECLYERTCGKMSAIGRGVS